MKKIRFLRAMAKSIYPANPAKFPPETAAVTPVMMILDAMNRVITLEKPFIHAVKIGRMMTKEIEMNLSIIHFRGETCYEDPVYHIKHLEWDVYDACAMICNESTGECI